VVCERGFPMSEMVRAVPSVKALGAPVNSGE